jgi:hypothetical protein
MNYIYELPFGRNKPYLSQGWASQVFGGWRIGVIHAYLSGLPQSLGTTVSFPTGIASAYRPTISTYDGWRGGVQGDKFNPNADKFFQPASFFGPQPTDRFGNMTRRNPKARDFPNYNENISLAKGFAFTESARAEFRLEAFNVLNRTRFGAISNATTLQNFNFGLWQAQVNQPRRMQLALKLYW